MAEGFIFYALVRNIAYTAQHLACLPP